MPSIVVEGQKGKERSRDALYLDPPGPIFGKNNEDGSRKRYFFEVAAENKLKAHREARAKKLKEKEARAKKAAEEEASKVVDASPYAEDSDASSSTTTTTPDAPPSDGASAGGGEDAAPSSVPAGDSIEEEGSSTGTSSGTPSSTTGIKGDEAPEDAADADEGSAMEEPPAKPIRPIPTWFDDGKFGIMVTWGVYSVPAFADPIPSKMDIDRSCSEWYWNHLLNPDKDGYFTKRHHVETYGVDAAYMDFAKDFKASHWSPDDWALLFEQAGAKYVVFTAKHHDGWCNWSSEHCPKSWRCSSAGPSRDLLGELSAAVTSRDLKMGVSYSLFEWYHPKYLSDKRTAKPYHPPTATEYTDDVMIPQLKELVLKYKPSLVWANGDWEQYASYWKSDEFLDWLHSDESGVAEEVVVNSRWGLGVSPHHGMVKTPTDRYLPSRCSRRKWCNVYNMGTSWGYNENHPEKYIQSTNDILHQLIKTVCLGGNFTLNVGPKADGTIPLSFVERLTHIGRWLETNGMAIYRTKPWTVVKEKVRFKPSDGGSSKYNWIWYTASKEEVGTVYGFVMDWGKVTAEDIEAGKEDEDHVAEGVLALPSPRPAEGGSKPVVSLVSMRGDTADKRGSDASHLTRVSSHHSSERGMGVLLPITKKSSILNDILVIKLEGVTAS